MIMICVQNGSFRNLKKNRSVYNVKKCGGTTRAGVWPYTRAPIDFQRVAPPNIGGLWWGGDGGKGVLRISLSLSLSVFLSLLSALVRCVACYFSASLRPNIDRLGPPFGWAWPRPPSAGCEEAKRENSHRGT